MLWDRLGRTGRQPSPSRLKASRAMSAAASRRARSPAPLTTTVARRRRLCANATSCLRAGVQPGPCAAVGRVAAHPAELARAQARVGVVVLLLLGEEVVQAQLGMGGRVHVQAHERYADRRARRSSRGRASRWPARTAAPWARRRAWPPRGPTRGRRRAFFSSPERPTRLAPKSGLRAGPVCASDGSSLPHPARRRGDERRER